VYVALYGYDTKDFIVSNHTRDADGNRMEYTVGSDNPNFTTVSNPGDGTWVVTADITGELAMAPADSVRRLEVAIAPSLQDADGNTVALNAPSSTFDLTTSLIDNEFYHANEIVKVDGCNACHDALATTFHSPIRGGNITVCRMCHVPTSGGSHLEMQSRSIDSYVHAIHKFQAFDIDKIDFNEPLEAAEYEEHIAHVFPNFTIKNCYACHNEGTNEVPDQSKSMPGIISGSESHATLAANGFDRDIGDVPAVVTGPAARACGGCHRAKMITDDDAGKLASFYQHTSLFGYLEEDGDGVLDEVIATIMAFFN
jgi:OmcA/MtrC family decaheme c-type cytochrome